MVWNQAGVDDLPSTVNNRGRCHEAANWNILTQSDLRRHIHFDGGAFRADARRINRSADVFKVSAFENTGLPRWLQWIEDHLAEKRPDEQTVAENQSVELFFG